MGRESEGLSCWLSSKETAWQCGRHRRCGFDPRVGKIPWRRKWQPTPVFLSGKSHGQRNLVGNSPRGHKESDTTERLHFHRSEQLRWPGVWRAWSLQLITSPVPAGRFSGCTTGAPSQVDVDRPEFQEVLVTNEVYLQMFGRWCHSGTATAPFRFWLPSCACHQRGEWASLQLASSTQFHSVRGPDGVFSSVHSLSPVQLFGTPWIAACQASCPSPTPGVYPNPCPSSLGCHPAISSSVIPLSSCLQSLPASESYLL